METINPPPMETEHTTKQCRICEQVLPVSEFNKHSGTKDKLDSRCRECMKKCKQAYKQSESKEYTIYPLDLTNTEWQVGKPTGSILLREDSKTKSKRYEVRIPIGNGKLKSKSFAFNDYSSEEETKTHAEAWMTQFSKENNLTKNMIRVIDETTIEVQLTQGKNMKTDIQFADICQKHCVCVTKSSNSTSEHYASISVNNKLNYFHKYITGNDMTDHMNRDPMDNRLVNLQKTTSKLNNNNRGKNKKIDDSNHMLGVRYNKKDDSWQARIKQDGKEYTKSFSVEKFGNDAAKELAIVTRKALNKKFQCNND